MPIDRLPTICGMYCGTCPQLGVECNGCEKDEGKPHWTNFLNVDICPIYDCCVNTKQLKHCGHCEKLLCEKYSQIRDPAFSDEQFNKVNQNRRDDLLDRLNKADKYQ